MASFCTGGVSIPKPGVEEVVAFSATALGAFVAKFFKANAAELLAPLLSTTTYVTADFCAGDPPSDPGLVPQDLVDALNYFNPLAQIAAIQKFEQWLGSQYWYVICECQSGSTPAAPTSSDPGDAGTNVGIPDASTGANCWDHSVTRTPNFVSGAWNFNDVMPVNDSGCTDGPINRNLIPTPAPSSIQFVVTVGSEGANPRSVELDVNFTTASCSTSAGGAYSSSTIAVGSTFKTPTIAIPSTAKIWAIDCIPISGSGTATNNVTVEAIIYCSGQGPSSLNAACCPPDPNLDQKLNQIIGLVQAIYSIIPVRVPSYAAFTAHSGLSGQGTLTLDSHTIAIKVEMTTLPGVYSVYDSMPDTYLDIGWLTPVNNRGPEAGVRLTRTTQVFALPDATSAVDYAWPSGAVVTITELQAG